MVMYKRRFLACRQSQNFRDMKIKVVRTLLRILITSYRLLIHLTILPFCVYFLYKASNNYSPLGSNS